MKKLLKADAYQKNVHEIDYIKLKEAGIKLLCFDLDNTLDEPDRITTKIEKEQMLFLNNLKENFEILIVSNNKIKGRVESFANIMDLKYIKEMNKPFQKKYKNNQAITNYQKKEIAFIGDKISTDILGANIYGSYSILVDPLNPKSKKWYALIMKFIDNIVTKTFMIKRGKYYQLELKNE